MEENINLDLLHNRDLFIEIHQHKATFVQLFAQLANHITEEQLTLLHPQSKGKKISKGNELSNCPYQVLDLVRNFDKSKGMNIRLLNWWGHGIYLLLYYGRENIPSESTYAGLLAAGFQTSLTGSPWDYRQMVSQNRKTMLPRYLDILEHTKKYRHLQLLKAIPYSNPITQLKSEIINELNQVFNIHRT